MEAEGCGGGGGGLRGPDFGSEYIQKLRAAQKPNGGWIIAQDARRRRSRLVAGKEAHLDRFQVPGGRRVEELELCSSWWYWVLSEKRWLQLASGSGGSGWKGVLGSCRHEKILATFITLLHFHYLSQNKSISKKFYKVHLLIYFGHYSRKKYSASSVQTFLSWSSNPGTSLPARHKCKKGVSMTFCVISMHLKITITLSHHTRPRSLTDLLLHARSAKA